MDRCIVCGHHFTEYFRKNGYLLLRCGSCGFISTDLKSFDYSAYYDGSKYFHSNEGCGYVDYETDKAPMRPFYASLLTTIKSHGVRGKLLDLGTATGYFLDIARDAGFLAEGLDINAAAVKEGRSKGRQVDHGDFLLKDFESGSFSAVTAFDFIEHLSCDSLKQYLHGIKRVLSRDNILAIITLDAGSVWARILGRGWHAFLPPEHLSYFNQKNIRLFLKQNGFDVLAVKTVNKRFTLQYIFNALYRWQGFPLWHFLTQFLSRRPLIGSRDLPLYIGDNMLILARKK